LPHFTHTVGLRTEWKSETAGLVARKVKMTQRERDRDERERERERRGNGSYLISHISLLKVCLAIS
jgi:hypothetical protein